jgi:anthraniloyl-CoA monooxygenase
MAAGNTSPNMNAITIVAAGRASLCLLARAHLFDRYWTRNTAHRFGESPPWPGRDKTVDRYTPRVEFHFGGDV